MGQGIYRCVGWGCLNPPEYDWDNDHSPSLFDILRIGYEAKPNYVMIPFGVDDAWLQEAWNLPPLPKGLPHIEDRQSVEVTRCTWWPDVGKSGIWVSNRIVETWNLVRVIASTREFDLPQGRPIFVADWD